VTYRDYNHVSRMRTIHWLFVVSVMLFISGIVFVVAAARSTAQPVVAAAEMPAITPVASVKHIMRAIVAPSARVVFDSVSTIVSESGVQENQPRTDDEWATVASNAAALVESANLLVMGDRPVDRGDWVKMSRALLDAGNLALKAAESKSTDGILAAGDPINASCDTCHERYWRQ
jgi:hypothetical protein